MEKIPEFIGNHMFLVTLLIAILMLLLWNLFGSAMSGIQQISAAEATRMMNHEKAVVLDIRSADDYAKGHILNALSLPESEIQSRKKELDKLKKQKNIVCSANDAISQRIVRILKAEGFEQVVSLKGGVAAWQSANLPLISDNS